MISKSEIRMQNNELEARVIELESQLRTLQADMEAAADSHARDFSEVEDERDDAQDELEKANNMIVSMVESRTAAPERFDDWYKRLHPRGPGSDPDPQVVAQSQYAKIIA